MQRLLSALVFSVMAVWHAPAQAAEPIPGVEQFAVKADHRAGLLAASLWYPAKSPTYRGLIGDNAVFHGSSAYTGAPIAPGRYPLFLLSHGSGGNKDTISWISAALAKRGAMVLSVNHPGSMTGDSSPRRSLQLADRAQDLSAALDMLAADKLFAPHIDPDRIIAMGFSLGGATALNLAGLRFDRDAYRHYCETILPDGEDCVFFRKGGVDFSALPDSFAANTHDRRVTQAVAIDPGMTFAVAEDSLGMRTPTLLLNLGREHLWKAVDVSAEGSNLINRLPKATFAAVSPAHHFTFLAVCKPNGAQILADERDDPVCDDPAGVDRAGAHEEIVAAIVGFVGL